MVICRGLQLMSTEVRKVDNGRGRVKLNQKENSVCIFRLASGSALGRNGLLVVLLGVQGRGACRDKEKIKVGQVREPPRLVKAQHGLRRALRVQHQQF